MRGIAFLMTSFGVLGAFLASTATSCAQGRYQVRREKRGEVTDTHPKLGTFAFINDAMEPPLKLRLFADAGRARNSFRDDLVSIGLGVAYGGKGPRLPVRPDRFELSWKTGERVVGLDNEQLMDIPEGRASLHTERIVAAARVSPLPFDGLDGSVVPTRFYADPQRNVFLHDDTELTPGSWFVDRVYFLVPEGLGLDDEPLRLSYRAAEGEEPLVSIDFRVEEDPNLHRHAFRKARHLKKKADKRERRRERKLLRESNPD